MLYRTTCTRHTKTFLARHSAQTIYDVTHTHFRTHFAKAFDSHYANAYNDGILKSISEHISSEMDLQELLLKLSGLHASGTYGLKIQVGIKSIISDGGTGFLSMNKPGASSNSGSVPNHTTHTAYRN